ncbi:PA0069 family radical SAM protein [Paracraurococcus ruber]|uniref:Radical SAM protein n=1 Tax=Paracraurococcus ruber TaxID=77675 RepID=A0ABS1D699_9PROT|nr:PA0069 family radical SAM protein [Paracraurococcus ruber]MBK1662415.1 radical SAM protein [Paracraurococcus ruber]TDG12343.1 PA0069 family radical SAM protein [Paracraurococcus ruber]
MPDGLSASVPADALVSAARRGRGAASNPAVRYESTAREAFDDGWGSLADLSDLPPLPTTLVREKARTALAFNDSPDIGFDRSLNPYRGCEHGCVYCYARPSHAYVGYSPGLDFETKLLFKPDLPALLEKELRRPGYEARPVALGANTDPYQPIERTLLITRQVLEVLERFGHPVTIVTKSAGVLRDLDILTRLARRNLVHVCLSVTTLDAGLARRMEPRAAAPRRRLQAMATLAQAGVPVGVLAAPMIPGLNDAELERILAESAAAGATRAGYVLLRLPLEIRQLFEEWLRLHVPDRAARVLALVRETRGGKAYDSRWGVRQTGEGPYADMLAGRFKVAAARHGLTGTNGRSQRLDCTQFRAPEVQAAPRQLALL